MICLISFLTTVTQSCTTEIDIINLKFLNYIDEISSILYFILIILFLTISLIFFHFVGFNKPQAYIFLKLIVTLLVPPLIIVISIQILGV